MNAITPIVAATDTVWADAYQATSEWRGIAVQRFACAEQAVSETLIVMSELKERADTIRLPHLTGQRFQALSDAIASNGPFATKGAAARDILATFRRHEDLGHFSVTAWGKSHSTAIAAGYWFSTCSSSKQGSLRSGGE